MATPWHSNASELESRLASGAQSGGGEEGPATMGSSGVHKSSSHRELEEGGAGEAAVSDGGHVNSGSVVNQGGVPVFFVSEIVYFVCAPTAMGDLASDWLDCGLELIASGEP